MCNSFIRRWTIRKVYGAAPEKDKLPESIGTSNAIEFHRKWKLVHLSWTDCSAKHRSRMVLIGSSHRCWKCCIPLEGLLPPNGMLLLWVPRPFNMRRDNVDG
ncbi:hypothetical protein pipiens_019205 [Culex pipiens pipiens]|uniref:Uncharacterized protein n=2 Tax=Culex pipiens TaxID=7175 RepID=A0ABD1DWH8_CULPP